MSISIQEAYKTLDTLQQMADNPELIMTGLFSRGVSDMNFPYQVNINGKYIFDYLKEYLQKIPVFKDCVVRICSADVYIDIPGLKYDFFFWLYIPLKKRKVSEVLQKQYDKLESNNKWAKEQYEKDIARQKFYREHAPKQIEKIKKKQEEIVQYLNGLGYVENADKSF